MTVSCLVRDLLEAPERLVGLPDMADSQDMSVGWWEAAKPGLADRLPAAVYKSAYAGTLIAGRGAEQCQCQAVGKPGPQGLAAVDIDNWGAVHWAVEGRQVAVRSLAEGHSPREDIPAAEDTRREQHSWLVAGLGPGGMAGVDHTTAGAVGTDTDHTVLEVVQEGGNREAADIVL